MVPSQLSAMILTFLFFFIAITIIIIIIIILEESLYNTKGLLPSHPNECVGVYM